MKRYDSYKPSGISWIGDIPSQWSLRRIKHIFSERKDKSITGTEIALSLTKDKGLIPSSEKINKTLESESLVGCKKISAGEIVFNRFRARLFALASVDGVVSPDYAVYRASDVCKPYIVTLLNTDIYRDAFNRKASGIGDGFSRLYTDDLFAFYVPYPPLAEQERIVTFLSTKTSCIDAQQRERERELRLLEELKQAEIASVVTRGLNPDVPMKDSGISWIGMIPEHWETKRIKSILTEAKEKTTTDGEGVLLSLSQYTGVGLKSEAEKTGMSEAESTIGYNVVHKGQFVMNIMLAWNGSYAVSELDGIISPSYCVFDFADTVYNKFFHYLWRLQSYQGAFKTMSKGIIDSRLRLYPIYFLAFNTIIPPIEEQRAIVEYIENKTRNIDEMVANLKAEIEYLTEYKQRLIADVVTGQIKVE